MSDKILINYRRVESLTQAQALKKLFDDKFGAERVFLDVSGGFKGGENWLQMLERQVDASAAMVVLIGKTWTSHKDEHGARRLDDPHDWVRFEISRALLRNMPIVPVLIDGATMPKQAQLPNNLMQLTHIQAMPLRKETPVQDAVAIAQRLEVLLENQQQLRTQTSTRKAEAITEERKALLGKRPRRGVPRGVAGLGLAAAAYFAGVATGPILLPQFGLQADDLPNPQFDIVWDCSDCPKMVVVPAGTFMMGSTDGRPDETPVHEVTITQSFAVGRFEVTFANWEACVAGGGCASRKKPDPEGWGKGRRPVINVSWDDAQEYVKWLSDRTNKPYRLLTEAEWEYAARAGTTTKYAFGDTINRRQAHFIGDSEGAKTVEVGSYRPNAWGLHDMHGNVWEWVEDCYQDRYTVAPSDGSARSEESNCSRRVLRGGAWDDRAGGLRSATRHKEPPATRESTIGFRVARAIAPCLAGQSGL